jgi:hypothetical protein
MLLCWLKRDSMIRKGLIMFFEAKFILRGRTCLKTRLRGLNVVCERAEPFCCASA